MDKQLKQRLLGAVVVTVLAVIIVPELIKDSPEEVREVETPIPVQQSETTVSLPEPEPVATAPAVLEPVVEPGAGESSDISDFVTEVLESNPSVQGSDGAGVQEQAATVPEPEDIIGEAAAQKADREKAARERAEREAAARKAAVRKKAEREATARREAARNEAARREAARKEAERREAARKEAERQKAAQTATRNATLPEIKLVGQSEPKISTSAGWMVQVGSFSLEENANLLRNRLRAQNYNAVIRRTTVGGRTLYRVRIGPQTTRAASEEIRQRLRAAGVNGNIVPVGG